MIREDELNNESILANQVPDFDADHYDEPVLNEEYFETPEDEGGANPEVQEPEYKNEASKYLGTKVGYMQKNDKADADVEEWKQKHHLTRVGEKIGDNADIRDGWMEVDRRLLGKRSMFYPEDWRFRIRPATVEAIRNWSTIDDENPNSIDDVFNEILKTCLSIVTSNGPLPWGNINSWDRFYFILLIREYTFVNGESKIQYDEDCVNCENPVTFTLTSSALDYELPDDEIMPYYVQNNRTWVIDPEEFEVYGQEPVTLYVPTLEKEANIKSWLIPLVQQNKKYDPVFIKFLVWMAPKISKDTTIAQRQIKEIEKRFKSWDVEMFSFMDDVIKNITIIPATKLITHCPICGEEVTSDIRFQNGVRSLFNMANKHKKFGKK